MRNPERALHGILTALAAAACLYATAEAGVSVGYRNLPGELAWVADEYPPRTSERESCNYGLFTVSYEKMQSLMGPLSLGFSLGIELPLTKVEFDRVLEGGPSATWNEGDLVTARIASIPVMTRLSCDVPAGPGRFSLGAGAGAALIGMEFALIDAWWEWSSLIGPNKFSDATWVFNKTQKWRDFCILPALEIVPGYRVRLAGRNWIGIRAPLSFAKKTVINRATLDYDPAYRDPDDSNPLIGGTRIVYDSLGYPSFEIGGFSWALSISYTRGL